MSASEVAHRMQDQARRWAWRRRQIRPGEVERVSAPSGGERTFPVRLPPGAASAVPTSAARALVDVADQLLQGRWKVFGLTREDLVDPDWFLDPVTGRRAPCDRFAFSIDTRTESEAGNVKQVWELSRHHHLTLLATAWFLTADDSYAQRVADHLRSWWRQNPFLSGVHWTSGIELALRLIAWSWVRRLLDRWSGVRDLFESNELAACQLRWHQQYLSAFRSTGSSANNHAVAEAAGQLVASCAFPWFPESGRWRVQAAALLERELDRNTFPSGVNRELASDYHIFVAELGLVAAVEAKAAGYALSDATWELLCRMSDAAAALVDERGHGPRQGDSDEGHALLLDDPLANRWAALLATSSAVLGPQPWWPALSTGDVRSMLLSKLATSHRANADADRSGRGGGRPTSRPSHFPDAGLTLIRTPASERPEIWSRCDAGPHGFLSIAAHAHADALSIEVRYGGVEVLADPGTYTYHGDPQWRAYFRSTLAHNTLELAGEDQSVSGGPFMWVSHTSSRLLDVVQDRKGEVESWSAEHDGYRRLNPPALHRRRVRLNRQARRLEVVDQVLSEGQHQCRLAFHLGPTIQVALDGSTARLEWPNGEELVSAVLELPQQLEWTAHRGTTDPILGWYAQGLGRKQPCVTLVGAGHSGSVLGELVTVLQLEADAQREVGSLPGSG
jgi:hypothetical protein